MDFVRIGLGGPRDSQEHIETFSKSIQSIFSGLFGWATSPTVVLNEYWQVIYSNAAFNQLAGVSDTVEVLGLRLGEILRCPHSGSSISGCGTSPECPDCAMFRMFYSSDGDAESGSLSGAGRLHVQLGADDARGEFSRVEYEGRELRVCSFIVSEPV